MTETKSGCDILIVEDDEAIREALKLALEFDDYHVTEASNGQEGLDLLKRDYRPSLIFLDLMMPVMDGWEFAKALEADAELSQIPIIVCTAIANKAQNIKSKLVIKKPVDLELVLNVARQFCSAHEVNDTNKNTDQKQPRYF